MKLPNRNRAIVPLSKVTGYLLSATHPQGRHKAAFFHSFGFVRDAPEALASALREHAAVHDVADVQDTLFLAVADDTVGHDAGRIRYHEFPRSGNPAGASDVRLRRQERHKIDDPDKDS